jgi:hypothetical protein
MRVGFPEVVAAWLRPSESQMEIRSLNSDGVIYSQDFVDSVITSE